MIDDKVLDGMFSLAGIDKNKLHETLRRMGPPRKKARKLWSSLRPTTGYCYAVTEVVSYFLNMHKIPHKTFRLSTEDGGSHWFVRLGEQGEGEIIDLTADQIDGRYAYEKAKRKAPQKNQHMKEYGISKVAEEIAKLMKII